MANQSFLRKAVGSYSYGASPVHPSPSMTPYKPHVMLINENSPQQNVKWQCGTGVTSAMSVVGDGAGKSKAPARIIERVK